MITSVAIQAYLTKIRALFKEQGFDDSMKVIYDAENGMADTWLSDELAEKRMPRKGMTTKEDVRSGPFMCLFWTRTSLTPVVRQRYRLLDSSDEGGPTGKSTVSASFRIACAFVSNKAEAVEDLEEAFAAVFQNTYNMPLSLQYIYNSEFVKDKTINFTFIQNMGEADLVNFKEGNLFAYAWSATIYMNYVSEFASSRVYPVEKVVVDLYGPGGFPISSLDRFGKAVMKTHTAATGETLEVPAEPTVALTVERPHDYVSFAITTSYAGVDPGTPSRDPSTAEIDPGTRELIAAAIVSAGGEVSLVHSTPTMIVANMPLSTNPPPEDSSSGSNSSDTITPDHDAYMASTMIALSEKIKDATGDEYVITPMPAEG